MACLKGFGAILVAVIGIAGASRGLASPAESGEQEAISTPAGESWPVWHPLRSGCFREVLGQSSVDWQRATPAHEGATSTSSLRFWSSREFGAEVLVIDSGGSPRLSADGSPFVVVASGAHDRTCVERMALDACPEAKDVRGALLEHRVRLGDDVKHDAGMTVLLGGEGHTVEVMDRFAKRNRWFFSTRHPDFPVMRERFASVDRCFAKVRDAARRWAADHKAPPPEL